MTKFALTAALVAAALAAPAVTSANPAFDAASVRVEVRDLDLSTAQGTSRLETRIENAVRSACAVSGRRSTADRSAELRCREQARAAAQRQLAHAAE